MTVKRVSIRRVLKWVASIALVLVVVVVAAVYFAIRALIEPDSAKFGNVQDEATKAGLTRTDFIAADDPYFVDMDKGILRKPVNGQYPPEIVGLATATGLDPETVRLHAIKGQNTWIVWTGGNDKFWDDMASITFGSFDLLKIVSSYKSQDPQKSQYYGRRNRNHYLGLVNEPCYTEPTKADEKRFGLWLDQRSSDCGPDPFADKKKYPGVKIGARGTQLPDEPNAGAVFSSGGKYPGLPLGSYYGEGTGILGLRLFPNPNFDEKAWKKWDPVKYYEDPAYYNDKTLVRPYRVGMSCAFCHVGPSPELPPREPEYPEWENINSNPGAQYFWVNRIFIWNTGAREAPNKPAPHERNFIYQLFHTNPPGSLDTSLVSTDYINNPRTMNAVYSVGARLEPTLRWGREKLSGGQMDNKQFQDYEQTKAFSAFWNRDAGEIHTARVLKDGSDSVGILGALNRVYLNIGLFSEEWVLHFRPIIGGRKISPIRIKDAVANSAYWGATEDQTADMAIFFLVTATPDKLENTPAGRKHLASDAAEDIDRGKVVFAENCAACHSSRIPDAPAASGIDDGDCASGGNGPNYRKCWDLYWEWAQTDAFKSEMTDIVLADDFLDNNFLSTERRVPVDLLGTNACSPLATNALKNDIWDDFSSDSYKQLPPVGELTVYHPVSGGAMSLQPAGNGRGYTRPASLVSLWSSAPYLLNNSVGFVDYPYTRAGYYTPDAEDAEAGYVATDYAAGYAAQGSATYAEGYYNRCPAASDEDPYQPCIDNRMRLFNDSIRKMLWPERRRTDTRTATPVPGYIYRTTATSCVKVPSGYMPDIVQNNPRFFHWLADWAIEKDGSLALGPIPEGFPVNALVNTEILPDNDQPGGMRHFWKLAKAGPTLYRAFSGLGGTCSDDALELPSTQARAEQVIKDSGLIDVLIGLSKCPDYVVNRGHYFGADLPDDDKEALILFLKRL